MELLSKVGKYEFMAEPFHCDFASRLFVGNLGNIMLNAADFHSNDRGYGTHYLQTIHRTWVLSRLAIEMRRMPQSYDRFNVETWVEGVMRYFTSRNFAVTDARTGEPMGYGRSIWAMIDTDTRQPVDILKVQEGLIAQYVEREKECPIAESSRVRMGADAEFRRALQAGYSDVDINGHVNSVKYIEHVFDLWPLDWYRRHAVRRFEIAYVAEAHYGDELRFYVEQTAPLSFCVRIAKHVADGDKDVETCRCLVVFEEI